MNSKTKTRNRAAALFALLLGSTLGAGAQQTLTPQTAFAEPALAPDKREIAFTSGGDIWTVASTGGDARLLVAHPAYESRPLYSPDGRYLAFQSTRTGNGDLYVLELATGSLRRLTFGDGADEVSAWSPDSRYLYFSSGDRDISSMKDVYRVPVSGGTPLAVSDNRYASEFMAVPAPKGPELAFVGRGFGLLQWWRKGHSHLDKSELWLLNTSSGQYRQLTQRNAKQLWPMWHPEGTSLYYVSDSNGVENLWQKPLQGAERPLTQFKDGRVLWPTMAPDGSLIVFERNFGIWTFDPANGATRALAITRRGAPSGPANEHLRLTSGFRDLALSPDGKKVAFVAYGDVFVAAAKESGDAVRLSTNPGAERTPVWLPNSNRVVYVSERDGRGQLYEYDFISGKERLLLGSGGNDGAPSVSPDGKQLAYVRNDGELHVLELASGKDRLLTTAYFDPSLFGGGDLLSWSPDGKWIAYGAYGPKAFRNAYAIPVAGGTAKPVSFLSNAFGGGIAWRDNKSLLFTTGQRTEPGYVARIDLVPQEPRFRENEFRKLFPDEVQTQTPPAAPAATRRTTAPADTLAKKPDTSARTDVRIDFEGIRERLTLLPLGADIQDLAVSRDGKTLVVLASAAGQNNIYSYSLDELSREPAVLKQLTSTAGGKRDLQIDKDGKEVFYIEDGRIQSVNLDSRQVRPLSVTAELDMDFQQTKMVVFEQAWEGQNKGFYDPAFHGADWKALRSVYAPYAAGAANGDELRRIISLMIGELNASHSGISGPPSGGPVTGYLGIRLDTGVLREGRLRVKELVALGPAALAGGVRPGDYILAVNGAMVHSGTNLDSLLEYKIGKRVLLTLSSDAAGNSKRDVAVRPISMGAEKNLRYRQWVQQQRDYVAQVSKGRLGYVHMYDMSQGSLDQLYVDMDQENHGRDGVVIDIRNNNGGFVNAYALDVFARKGYMTMTRRGLPKAPARLQLGQRSLEAPTILVINQHSLSDAEDFTEGYRTLGLGKVVGEPTSGWIIYTSSLTLLDGSTMRMPFILINDHEGKNMELAPRPVDIFVSRPFGEEGKDSQLDTAVSELLRQIDQKK
ncbi:MAG: PDZ domain-containing protein [Chitinophagaceae bacterium]|nr:MAG: PDZ domain-containing protein [Chitinophagaceae bacterium]